MSRQSVAVASWLLAVALMSATPAIADDLRPEAFMAGIVGKEIDGDVLARRGKVIYSDGKQVVGDCGCSVPRDLWDVDQGSFNIVTAWDIISSKAIGQRKYKIAVRFHVIARAMHNYHPGWAFGEFQQVLVPPHPTDEVVTYRLIMQGNEWAILNPPEPRVSPRALWDELNRQLAFETDLKRRGEDEHDEKTVAYREAAIHGYMAELNTLRYAVIAAGLPGLK